MSKKQRIPVPEAQEMAKEFLQEFCGFAVARGKVKGQEFNLQLDLPRYVRAIRAAYGQMTQADLAEALEVDHTYISKIEGGKTPSFEFMERLAFFVTEQEKGEQ